MLLLLLKLADKLQLMCTRIWYVLLILLQLMDPGKGEFPEAFSQMWFVVFFFLPKSPTTPRTNEHHCFHHGTSLFYTPNRSGPFGSKRHCVAFHFSNSLYSRAVILVILDRNIFWFAPAK